MTTAFMSVIGSRPVRHFAVAASGVQFVAFWG
jgi:hypothetical protein